MESAFLLLLAIAIGITAHWLYTKAKIGSFASLANQLLARAEAEAEVRQKAQELALQKLAWEAHRQTEEAALREERKRAEREERLKEREEKLDKKRAQLDKKLVELEKRESACRREQDHLKECQAASETTHAQLLARLEQTAGFSQQEAKEQLLARLLSHAQTEAEQLRRKIVDTAQAEAERQARMAVATALNRLASVCTAEATVTTVSLPNEEMKGRVIGREGRNIRLLEKATGCDFVIDDAPGAVVISCFDPVRKQIAKLALQELIQDGRIHPTRIEEAVAKAQSEVERRIHLHGEDAAQRAGAAALHPDLIDLLGKLYFRYSYGQNVMEHSLEVSHLMGLMAAELGLDQRLAQRIGLLHDIGKAITHELEGSHAMAGHDIALRCGEPIEVANGIGCHHNEIPPMTAEGALCIGADAISASRPGARIEAVGEYMKRLKKLEELTRSFAGVERAFAFQAGREVHITVLPDSVDDEQMASLAREITSRIEQQLSYPGRIKVTLVREKRITAYAT